MKTKLIYITLFAIAMASLESAVVVYLRELYYPDGFDIIFRPIKELVIKTELIRELGTLAMLLTIACLTDKESHKRFAWFLYSFAVWDIFYYFWLKVFINWPLSIFEWDILFLLPITWLGPVLAPLLCSFLMIVLALVILNFNNRISKIEWGQLIIGSFFILYTFMFDYGKMFIENGFWKDFTNLLSNTCFLEKASELYPIPFQWGIFNIGLFFISTAIALYIYRNKLIINQRFQGITHSNI